MKLSKRILCSGLASVMAISLVSNLTVQAVERDVLKPAEKENVTSPVGEEKSQVETEEKTEAPVSNEIAPKADSSDISATDIDDEAEAEPKDEVAAIAAAKETLRTYVAALEDYSKLDPAVYKGTAFLTNIREGVKRAKNVLDKEDATLAEVQAAIVRTEITRVAQLSVYMANDRNVPKFTISLQLSHFLPRIVDSSSLAELQAIEAEMMAYRVYDYRSPNSPALTGEIPPLEPQPRPAPPVVLVPDEDMDQFLNGQPGSKIKDSNEAVAKARAALGEYLKKAYSFKSPIQISSYFASSREKAKKLYNNEEAKAGELTKAAIEMEKYRLNELTAQINSNGFSLTTQTQFSRKIDSAKTLEKLAAIEKDILAYLDSPKTGLTAAEAREILKETLEKARAVEITADRDPELPHAIPKAQKVYNKEGASADQMLKAALTLEKERLKAIGKEMAADMSYPTYTEGINEEIVKEIDAAKTMEELKAIYDKMLTHEKVDPLAELKEQLRSLIAKAQAFEEKVPEAEKILPAAIREAEAVLGQEGVTKEALEEASVLIEQARLKAKSTNLYLNEKMPSYDEALHHSMLEKIAAATTLEALSALETEMDSYKEVETEPEQPEPEQPDPNQPNPDQVDPDQSKPNPNPNPTPDPTPTPTQDPSRPKPDQSSVGKGEDDQVGQDSTNNKRPAQTEAEKGQKVVSRSKARPRQLPKTGAMLSYLPHLGLSLVAVGCMFYHKKR